MFQLRQKNRANKNVHNCDIYERSYLIIFQYVDFRSKWYPIVQMLLFSLENLLSFVLSLNQSLCYLHIKEVKK